MLSLVYHLITVVQVRMQNNLLWVGPCMWMMVWCICMDKYALLGQNSASVMAIVRTRLLCHGVSARNIWVHVTEHPRGTEAYTHFQQ